ncbi:MAG TPA: tRNA preQ1(34) S-adenosylmethionine ribosyltransferase-isomerase QueA [Kofleriaceae bacterium]|nr:tRNA preQ1(34) S-adenosylmethionine ribosyltransferase-isomerase QueA [Kofleriaceae bacterium]
MFAPSDYTFELPPELIAQHPAERRDASRLLHLHADGSVSDHEFRALVELLPADAVLIANDTRVIPARVLTHKASGGAVELLFLEPLRPRAAEPESSDLHVGAVPAGMTPWRCLARARRALRPGQLLRVDGAEQELPVLSERAVTDGTIAIGAPGDGLRFLEEYGHIPLPSYIERPDAPVDRERYQTMFARVPGAVAAPTAGLHMTPDTAAALAARGVTLASVTLHVGWGTFAPIRAQDVREHRMHRERYEISEATAALVASGRPIAALGTTALRALESAATAPRTLRVGAGATELFIYPGSGHSFRVVEHLVTNFHLPESTLLMLVCAFAGTERVLRAYRHAVAQRYRFFSYGDAMLLHRAPE